jgi:hypothetical protein
VQREICIGHRQIIKDRKGKASFEKERMDVVK